MMRFSELLEHCITCIKTFNPVIKTIDSHADEYIANVKDPYEKVFIKQIFYGCTRYEEFLKIFSKVFFDKCSSSTNRNDITLYQIFAYLSFFRLDELQIADFRKLVMSQESTKMHVFLQFAFNAETLRLYLREEWMTIFDFNYIDEKIIGGVENNLPKLADILKTVEKRATGKNTSALSATSSHMNETQTNMSQSHMSHHNESAMNATAQLQDEVISEAGEEYREKKVTKIEPFNLTRPKPKMIPPPEQIKREVKANPVPKAINKRTLADIEREKKERRQATINAIRSEYEANPKKAFAFAAADRPSTKRIDEVKKQVEEEIKKELEFKVKARPAPKFDDEKVGEIKLTAAALKREKHLLDLEAKEKQAKLDEMSRGLKDASEFNRWRREMDEKDDVERMEHIQKKKIEMELAREEAIAARQRKQVENQQLVEKMKIQSEVRLDERAQNLAEDFERRKKIIEGVHANDKAASEQMELIKKENKRIRDEVHREMAEARKKKADEEAIELAKRAELIRQIRELEKIPIQRTKGFDPTEAGGHGLMEEMSIAELRERLEYEKRQQEQQVEFKRESNLTKKQQERDRLAEERRQIEEAREKRKMNNEASRKIRRAEEAAQREAERIAREKGELEVREKIREKNRRKKEREDKLALELKEVRLQRQYQNQNVDTGDDRAEREVKAAQERQQREQRNNALLEKCHTNQIKVRDLMTRADIAKQSVMQKLAYDKDYADRLSKRKEENDRMLQKNQTYIKTQHDKQKIFENTLKEKARRREPFKAKINEQSLAKATQFRARKEAETLAMKSAYGQSVEYADIGDQHDMSAYDEQMEGGLDQASGLDLMGEEPMEEANDIAAKLEME